MEHHCKIIGKTHIELHQLNEQKNQWEFQDAKMGVLYHIRAYFVGIFPYIGLIYGRYLQFRFCQFLGTFLSE